MSAEFTASTGPCSPEHGMSPLAGRLCASFASLQRGRAHLSTECGAPTPLALLVAVLQRGRAHLSTECTVKDTALTPVYTLQRGRAHLSTEWWVDKGVVA